MIYDNIFDVSNINNFYRNKRFTKINILVKNLHKLFFLFYEYKIKQIIL